MPTDPTAVPPPAVHQPLAFGGANDTFIGGCTAGDFEATTPRPTADAAKADVKDHVDSMQ